MNFFQSLWQRRWLRGLAWTLGTLITLYALFFAWMNHAGAKRWSEAQAMIAKEGESLDFRTVTPQPIADEANYCAIEPLKDLSMVINNKADEGEPAAKRKRLEAAALPSGDEEVRSSRPKQALGAKLGKATDLKAWAEWLRKEGTWQTPDSGDAAHDVLAAMSKQEPLFAELSAGLSRSGAQWTPAWKTRELPAMLFSVQVPHYGSVQRLAPTLALRATAAARAGKASEAHESCLIMLKLAEASLKDPFIIGALVACAEADQACGAVWEFCDARCGTAEDYRRLERQLRALDVRAGLLNGFRGEMAAGASTVFWMKQTRDASMFDVIAGLGEERSPIAGLAIKAIPGGWFDANAASMVQLEWNHILKPLRDQSWRETIQAGGVLESTLKQRRASTQIDSIFACMAVPSLSKVALRAAYVQCLLNEAIAACALEVSRMEKGSYPDSLDVVRLTDGKPLPMDVLGGKPMGYRKTTDGKYQLWSIGFDGKDDGGKRVLDDKKPETTKFSDASYAGDWVWDFAGSK